MKNALASMEFPRLNPDSLGWAGGLLLTLGLFYLLQAGQMNLLFAIVIGGTLLLISFGDRATGAIWTLGYLTIMGDIRRIFAVSFGTPKLDLLLLVGPVIAVVMAVPLLFRLRLKDPLSKAMLVLLLVMLLQIFNPLQGGITVGATGALFYIVPVLWFWIGRQIGSPALIRRFLYKCLFPLAIISGAMGICQTFIGFLPYQQAWIDVAAKSYVSLHLGGTIRPFGFSVSAAEYAALVQMGACASAAAFFGVRKKWALALPFMVAALILASGRTSVIRLIFSLAIVYTLRSGRELNTRALFRLGVLMVVGLIGVFAVASRFSSSPGAKPVYQKGAAAQNALEHQASGFAHPLDQRSSTAGAHAKAVLDGVVQGFVAPLGRGLGGTTLAAKRFGSANSIGSSEIDISDMFLSLGLIGGLTYLGVIYQSIRYTLRYVQKVPKEISLPVLAVLASTLSTWLIGGQYSTSSILFFLIGGLVHQDSLKMQSSNGVRWNKDAASGLPASTVPQY